MDAVDTFVLQLGRVAKRGSRHLRGLTPADRDDVIAAAIADCWESRATFDQHQQPLEDWFALRLKAARRTLTKDHARRGTTDLEAIAASNDTERDAGASVSMAQLRRKLTLQEQEIARLIGLGFSVTEINARLPLASTHTVRSLKQRLKKAIRNMLPDDTLPSYHSRPLPLSEDREIPPSLIDHALHALLGGPQIGKECPPCWRCCWFLGYLPAVYTPSQVVDPEVRAAVRATEQRKIEIANGVRSRYVEGFAFNHEEMQSE